MKNRPMAILTVLIGIGALTLVLLSKDAQTQKPQPRTISILQLGKHPVIDSVAEGFEKRIKSLFSEKINVRKYNANFDGMTLSNLAKQLVSSDSDIVVGVTTPASGQLIGASRGSKPIVFTFVSDLNSLGYSEQKKTLHNTTGLSDHLEYEKVFAMIRSILPNAKKIGYILTRSESNAVVIHDGFQKAAPFENFQIKTASIGSTSDIRSAAALLADEVDLFLIGGDNTLASGLNIVLDIAKAKNIPVFANDEISVSKGAVAAYSVDYEKMGERTADICGLVLAGASPENIPVELFSADKLVINLKIANELGLSIPLVLSKSAKKIYR